MTKPNHYPCLALDDEKGDEPIRLTAGLALSQPRSTEATMKGRRWKKNRRNALVAAFGGFSAEWWGMDDRQPKNWPFTFLLCRGYPRSNEKKKKRSRGPVVRTWSPFLFPYLRRVGEDKAPAAGPASLSGGVLFVAHRQMGAKKEEKKKKRKKGKRGGAGAGVRHPASVTCCRVQCFPDQRGPPAAGKRKRGKGNVVPSGYNRIARESPRRPSFFTSASFKGEKG